MQSLRSAKPHNSWRYVGWDFSAHKFESYDNQSDLFDFVAQANAKKMSQDVVLDAGARFVGMCVT